MISGILVLAAVVFIVMYACCVFSGDCDRAEDTMLEEKEMDILYGNIKAALCWKFGIPGAEEYFTIREDRPVVHGRWVDKGGPVPVCSVCLGDVGIRLNGKLIRIDLSCVPFCPQCGAVMDLEENDG